MLFLRISYVLCLAIYSVMVAGKVVEREVNLHVDKTNWKDPHDLFNDAPFVLETTPSERLAEMNCREAMKKYDEALSRLRTAYAELENRRENSVDVLLKHILRQLFRDLEVESTETSIYKKAYVSLTDENFDVIKRYLSSQKAVEEIALRERLRVALDGFLSVDKTYEESNWLDFLHRYVPYLFIFNCIVLVPAFIIVIKAVMSKKQIFWLVMSVCFCISFYFTYIRKYQEVLARRVYAAQKNGANICEPSSFVGEAWNALLGLVKIKDKDECLKKYEDILIEPLYELNPLDVVVEVLTNAILTPLAGVGRHTNAFFNEFFRDTPLWLTAIKLAFLLVVIILIFFYFSGFRVRTFLATFEPTAAPILEYLPRRLSIMDYFEPPRTPRRKKLPQALHASRSQPNALQRKRTPCLEVPESDTDADVSTNTTSSNETFVNLDDSLVTKRRPSKRSLSASARVLK